VASDASAALKMCGRNTAQEQVGDAASSPGSSLDATALRGAKSEDVWEKHCAEAGR